jgi:negative regulator of sigma E activity
MTQTSFRDVEQLSALLDEKLDQADVARLQNRLKIEPELRAVYNDLRETRFLLRQLPQRRAPRNFTLKPSAARVRPPLPRSFPIFRLASALASILLFFSVATNSALPALSRMAAAQQIAYGMGGGDPSMDRAMGGGGSAADAAPEAALEIAPAAPAPEEPAAEAEEPSAKTAEPTFEATLAAEPTPEVAALPAAEEAMPFTEEQPWEEPLPAPAPIAPPIPAWAVIALGMLALISGGAAFFLRWQSDQRWKIINITSKK